MTESIHETIKKWEKTHLLDELSADKKVRCAMSLEEMANILMKKKSQNLKEVKGKTQDEMGGELFPIVRRLYGENIKLMPTMQSLYEDYVAFLNGDIEAFLVEAYVNDFVKRINNQKI